MVARKEKVIVAMSGGVDSSVAVALLLRKGMDVVGVTLDVWPHDGREHLAERHDACCSLSAVEDARRVADKLGIPHYTLNFREVFARTVIADFASEYSRGRTPNPCIRCNEHVKFGALLERTRALDADYIATGHYARIVRDRNSGRYLLRKGVDNSKDQSYVLYVMTQELLARTLMPLGNLTKAETRELASSLGLATADKPESQEICFVTDDDYGRFIQEYAPDAARSGPIVDGGGRVVGQHRGIVHYTIGQRRGLGAASARRYVVDIDTVRNTIIVGDHASLYHDTLVAENINLISLSEVVEPVRVSARIRYRAVESPAWLLPLDANRLAVRFARPQRAITPGQAVVFYQDDVVVGGGTIASVGKGR